MTARPFYIHHPYNHPAAAGIYPAHFIKGKIMLRHPDNPIITRADIPDIPPNLIDVTSVFNPGAVIYDGKTQLMLRVQNRARETFFLMAESTDGVRFEISDKPVHFKGIEKVKEKIYHNYDARISQIDGIYYIMFAMDMDSGCFLGLARTENFFDFDFMGIVSEEDNRNGVLFPEKVGGKFLRFDRPNEYKIEGGGTTGNTIVLSESEDLLSWRQKAPVINGRFHYWDELIGAGPPPVKTREGWVQLYHGVATHLSTVFIYQAGVMLLDLDDPSKVTGRCPYNILEPREIYELAGQVPNVVFPSGMIVKDIDHEGFAREDSDVFVYYGAADTSVGLAVTTIDYLVGQTKLDREL